jgi:hypothetical protein
MSILRADSIRNREGTGAPNLPNGITVTGVATATSFSGNLTGNVTGNLTGNVTGNVTGNLTGTATTATLATNAQGLTGTPSITVQNATVQGDLTVNGTTTTLDTVNLVIEDKNIGIGTTSSASNTTADGAGFTIFGGAGGDKTLTWERGSSSFVYSDPNKFKGVLETVSAATTYNSGNNLVLELDVRNATTYTYTIPTGANIGIVSFKNMPAFTGNANGTTITCIFTQMSTTPAGTGNTTGTTGIGTNCFVTGYENGAAVAGISTRALVGSATTITLSATSNDRDFVSFFVHYTGGTNTTATSYQVYATKNGGFRQGNVGV